MRLRHALLSFLFLASGATAQTYSGVVDPAGDLILHDLDWREGTLYATNILDDEIVSIDFASGAVTPEASLGFDPRGLAWDGVAYRVSTGFDSSNPEIFTVGADGSTTGSIPAPSDLTNGLTFHDGLLWAARAYPDNQAAIVGLDPASGAVVETIAFPSTQPTGIAFLGDGTLWASNAGDDSGSSGVYEIYHIDRASGAILGTLGVPEGTEVPRGLAYDGSRYLYVTVREVATSLVYQIDLGASGNAQVVVSPEFLDFGVVIEGETETRDLVISNTGDGPLAITNVNLFPPPDTGGSMATTLRDTTVQAGESITVQVALTSSISVDPLILNLGGVLQFSTNDVQHPLVFIDIGGVGVFADPTAYIAPGQEVVDFGEVRISPEANLLEAVREVMVQNLGAQPLVIQFAEPTDGAFSLYDSERFPISMDPAETRHLRIGFRPTATGAYAATLALPTNDPASPLALSTSGTGTNPTLTPGSPLWMLRVPDNPATGFDDQKVHSLVSTGDITGDGLRDLAFAARNYLTVALDANARDEGGTGVIRWSFNSCPSSDNCGSVSGNQGLYGSALASGVDLSGDAVPDVVIATEGGNDHVYALDGKTGAVLWQVGSDTDPYLASYTSVSVREGLDVTFDGIPDVATGTGTASPESPDPVNNRRVYMLDGASGAEIWSAATSLPNFRTQIIESGQLGPIVVSGGGEPGSNHLTAYSGRDGSPLWSFDPGFSPFVIEPIRTLVGEDAIVAGLGTQVARFFGQTGLEIWRRSVGGSSVWDLAVLSSSQGHERIAVGHSGSSLTTLDAHSGEVVWTAPIGGQGFGVAAVPDVNADGEADVAVVGKSGVAYLLSGADGTEIWTYTFGDGSFDLAGEVAVAVPDLDANGVPEVAFGTRDGRVILLYGGGGLAGTGSTLAPVAPLAVLDAPFPNPSTGPVTLRYRLAVDSDVHLGVYDALGREVWTHTSRQRRGSVAMDLPAVGFSVGTYVVRLQTEHGSDSRRFVIAW